MKHQLKNRKVLISVIIVAVIVILVIIFSTRKGTTQAIDTLTKVVAEPIVTADIIEKIPVTGGFEPLVRIEVTPEISGQLQRLRLEDDTLVEEGFAVKQGQVIAVINHDIYLAQSNEFKATLQAASVALADAIREENRIIKLFESGSATEQARDKAVTAARLAEAQYNQAEAALERINVILDKTTIKAPTTGVISKKYVDEENMVGPATPLVEIIQMEILKVLGGISERYLSKIVPGETAVSIGTDAYPQEEFMGKVFRVATIVDPVTRTFEVEIRVPNSDGRLKPGMFARMTIEVDKRKKAVVIPDSAIIRQGNQVYAFVVNNSKAHRCNIKLGSSQGQLYEVLDGLSAGEMVITHGQTQLKDGQTVEVVQEINR